MAPLNRIQVGQIDPVTADLNQPLRLPYHSHLDLQDRSRFLTFWGFGSCSYSYHIDFFSMKAKI